MCVPTFHCCSYVGINHYCSFLCYVLYMFWFWHDGIDVTSKCSEFMNTGIFYIPDKVLWGVFQFTINFASINFSGCFLHTKPFFWIFIAVNECCYKNDAYNSVVALILPTDTWYIYTSRFQGQIKSRPLVFLKRHPLQLSYVFMYVAPS